MLHQISKSKSIRTLQKLLKKPLIVQPPQRGSVAETQPAAPSTQSPKPVYYSSIVQELCEELMSSSHVPSLADRRTICQQLETLTPDTVYREGNSLQLNMNLMMLNLLDHTKPSMPGQFKLHWRNMLHKVAMDAFEILEMQNFQVLPRLGVVATYVCSLIGLEVKSKMGELEELKEKHRVLKIQNQPKFAIPASSEEKLEFVRRNVSEMVQEKITLPLKRKDTYEVQLQKEAAGRAPFLPPNSKQSHVDLFQAVHNNDVATVIWLLIEDNLQINLADGKKKTLLHYAVQQGHVSMVRILMDFGSNILSHDESHTTPLDLAFSIYKEHPTDPGVKTIISLLDSDYDNAKRMVRHKGAVYYTTPPYLKVLVPLEKVESMEQYMVT